MSAATSSAEKPRLLLTGASGYLGQNLAPRLSERYNVIGLDVKPGPFTKVVGSFADRALIQRLFTVHRFAAVVNAGALHKPDIGRGSKMCDFVETNVSGTLILLEAAASMSPP